MGIDAESCRRNARIDRKGAISAAADCAEFAKKKEITNILFNIMDEKRAKRGYKRRKGIAAFREGYEQHGKHGGVKKGRKEKWKKVLTKACGGGIIAKLSDERDKRARPR